MEFYTSSLIRPPEKVCKNDLKNKFYLLEEA